MPKNAQKQWWWYKRQKEKAAKAARQLEQQPKGILDPVVAEIFGRHLIHDNIFICLSAASLARMAMVTVCRDVRAATLDFTARAYNLNRRLAHFFRDPLAFRALMARTRLVISGYFALQFHGRTFYPEADLDLYVRTEGSFREIGLWLQDEGYAFKPSSKQAASFLEEAEELDDEQWEDYREMRMTAVYYTFEQGTSASNLTGIRKVQVIVPPVYQYGQMKYWPIDVIMRYHSTCVMNFITYEAAYSLYPYATSEKRCALVFIDNAGSQHALAKYAARGFIMLECDVNFRKCRKGAYKDRFCSPGFLIDCNREVGDRFTWVLPFPQDGESSDNTGAPPQSRFSSAPSWSSGIQRCWTIREFSPYMSSILSTRFRVGPWESH